MLWTVVYTWAKFMVIMLSNHTKRSFFGDLNLASKRGQWTLPSEVTNRSNNWIYRPNGKFKHSTCGPRLPAFWAWSGWVYIFLLWDLLLKCLLTFLGEIGKHFSMKHLMISPRNIHEFFFLKIGSGKVTDISTRDPKGGIC